ncbi:glutaminase [Wenyingzhuangia sp. IMCC45574]
MNYLDIIQKSAERLKGFKYTGKQADYIPELATVDPNLFAVTLTCVEGKQYNYGDSATPFSIQSISKVFSLIMAYDREHKKLWKRLGIEPSGTPFNSLVLLEYEKGIPRNPFINAGAIVIADVLLDHLKNPEQDFLNFIHTVTNDTSIDYDLTVFESEKKVAYRNYALVHMMKSFGNINNKIEDVMNFYFMMCSVAMNSQQLSNAFLFLANNGIDPSSGKTILSPSKTKRINAIMQLCGFYDEAGEFAYRVGLPGKSGVGGGISAVHPGKFSITVFSPTLNAKGNSEKGMAFLEELTTLLESSIF